MATQKKSLVSLIVGRIVGLAIMVGGVWIHVQVGMIQALEKQGINLDPGESVSAIGALIFLFPLIDFFFVTPLMEAIGSRNSELEKTFSEAEDLRAEMGKMRTEYEQRLASTEAAAREQIQAQIKEAQNLRASLMAEAAQKADELVKQATVEIEREKNRLMTELRAEVVNLTLMATEKVLGETIDETKNRRLIEEFIDKVEVPS